MSNEKMSTKQAFIEALCKNPECFYSGQALANELGVSRAAIHKAALALQKQGWKIEAIPRRGYRLQVGADLLCAEALGPYPAPCYFYETLPSTNRQAKMLAADGAPHGTIVFAGTQTEGRGRMGRTFSSPEGSGIYMTLLLRPTCSAHLAQRVTTSTAVAIARVVERLCGISLSIKWVNDLYYQEKKVCGILTEAITNFETGEIDWIAVGIGLNLSTTQKQFGEELSKIATSLYPDGVASIGRVALGGEIAREILALCPSFDTLAEYRGRCFTPGHWVTVRTGQDAYTAKAISIQDDGGLLIEQESGRKEVLYFGEVSVKPARVVP